MKTEESTREVIQRLRAKLEAITTRPAREGAKLVTKKRKVDKKFVKNAARNWRKG